MNIQVINDCIKFEQHLAALKKHEQEGKVNLLPPVKEAG